MKQMKAIGETSTGSDFPFLNQDTGNPNGSTQPHWQHQLLWRSPSHLLDVQRRKPQEAACQTQGWDHHKKLEAERFFFFLTT